MPIKTCHVPGTDAGTVVRELARRFGESSRTARLAVYFAHCSLAAEKVAGEMVSAFPAARILGCCSGQEFVNGRFPAPGVAAMLFGQEIFEDIEVELVGGLSGGIDLHPVFDRFRARARERGLGPDPTREVGLALIDGATCMDDLFVERIGDSSDVLFVGGTAAGMASCPASTWVAADGRVARDAGVVAVLRPRRPWLAAKVQSYRVKEAAAALTVTRIDPADKHLVLELDGERADTAYRKAFGLDEERLDKLYGVVPPLGVVANGELFVRCIKAVEAGRGLRFYGRVPEGQKFRQLLPTDPLAGMAERLAEWRGRLGPTTTVLEFLCHDRYMGLLRDGLVDDYGRLYGDTPMAGLLTFGEAYLGYMNSTSTLLAFG